MESSGHGPAARRRGTRRNGRRAGAVVGCLAALGLVPVILVTGGCAGLADSRGFTAAPLHGIVFDGSGAPLGWAEIRVDGAQMVQSDIDGRFIVPGVRRGRVRITAAKEGHERVTREAEFVSRTQVLYVRLHSVGDLVRAAADALSGERVSAAVAYANRALAVDGESASARYAAACAHLRSGAPEETLRLLEAGWPVLVDEMSDSSHEEEIHDEETRRAVRLLLARTRAALDTEARPGPAASDTAPRRPPADGP